MFLEFFLLSALRITSGILFHNVIARYTMVRFRKLAFGLGKCKSFSRALVAYLWSLYVIATFENVPDLVPIH